MFGNKMPRKIFGPKKMNELYSATYYRRPNIVNTVKSKRRM
jgi:hypothetical protein